MTYRLILLKWLLSLQLIRVPLFGVIESSVLIKFTVYTYSVWPMAYRKTRKSLICFSTRVGRANGALIQDDESTFELCKENLNNFTSGSIRIFFFTSQKKKQLLQQIRYELLGESFSVYGQNPFMNLNFFCTLYTYRVT